MSLRTLPILFINMGGEMLYILEQRLSAQSVKADKSSRVLTDIVSTMFSEKLLSQLFMPQELYSRKTMRSLFDKLAHTSIMRLNATSMDKLYDLMTMAVKYQVQNTKTPEEIILMTLNHLDGIRKIIEFSDASVKLVDNFYKMFQGFYLDMSGSELQLVKHNTSLFFQDIRVKVSILLRENKQSQRGTFYIPISGAVGTSVYPPGTIWIFGPDGEIKSTFEAGGAFTEPSEQGCTDRLPTRSRGTDLGTNMYKEYASSPTPVSEKEAPKPRTETPGVTAANEGKLKAPNAHEELKLLNLLIGTEADIQTFNFNLDFLNNPDDTLEPPKFRKSKSVTEAREQKVLHVDARRDASNDDKLAKMENLAVKEPVRRVKSQGEELLDLMDEM